MDWGKIAIGGIVLLMLVTLGYLIKNTYVYGSADIHIVFNESPDEAIAISKRALGR